MYTIMVSLIILVMGLIYLTQASGARDYDYKAKSIDDKINQLSAKKADLEVENARLTSLETVKNSDVAAAMTEPRSVEYVQ